MMAEESTNKIHVSNRYLFFTFLKVGSISFGGNMALLAVVERTMVEKDKSFTSKSYFDAIGIASLLPGPMAVNVVTFIGYSLNKKRGALVSLAGILLPACLLMLLLSWVYFAYANHYESSDIIHYVAGAVSAIIASTSLSMHQKEIGRNIIKNIICFLSFAILLATSSYLATLGLIVVGIFLGVTGWMDPVVGKSDTKIDEVLVPFQIKIKYTHVILVTALIIIECLFFFNIQSFIGNIYGKIAIVFAGVSLSLFGGGFVAVPIMQSLFVSDLAWLSPQEFVDAIAFSQITPGPILVSATFIGYKMGGILGAILATVSMFAPSAAVIILFSKLHALNKNNLLVSQALDGIKVVIIGMIAASAFKIIIHPVYNVKAITLFLIIFFVIRFFRVSPFVSILSAALIGLIIEKVI
jgi:chromate transporter